jgi:uncharacterized membrane protein
MTFVASAFPLLAWLSYAVIVPRVEKHRPSLSGLMNGQRVRWVRNAVHRDTPIDAILSGNIMNSVAFFASTTVLLILALFTLFGQLDAITSALSAIELGGPRLTRSGLELHLAATLTLFIVAFLTFTLSLRQFNHFCIMLGASAHDEQSTEDEILAIAELNSLGARNFNQGIRAYYFSIGSLAWLLWPLAGIAATLVIAGMLIYREFFSPARALIVRLNANL